MRCSCRVVGVELHSSQSSLMTWLHLQFLCTRHLEDRQQQADLEQDMPSSPHALVIADSSPA